MIQRYKKDELSDKKKGYNFLSTLKGIPFLSRKKHRREIFFFLKYGLVGGIGVFVNMLVLYFLFSKLNIHYFFSSLVATEIAIISNFFGNEFFTFKEKSIQRGKNTSLFGKFLRFQFISVLTVIGTASLLSFFIFIFGIRHIFFWNALSILALFLLNFLLNRKFTWNVSYDTGSAHGGEYHAQ